MRVRLVMMQIILADTQMAGLVEDYLKLVKETSFKILKLIEWLLV